jgi:hypothetical protein
MTTMSQREQPVIIEFSGDVNQQQIKTPIDVTSKQAALRRCHEQLNHMPFSRLQSMAKQGLLPRYFADMEAPMCASCAYGKATRQPWRTKGAQGQTTKLIPIRRSGDWVLVNQMESPAPGSVGQIKGWLTTKRYCATTVFVDHYSQLTCAYMQFSTRAEETVNAKMAFEAFAAQFGVTICLEHVGQGGEQASTTTNYVVLWRWRTSSKRNCQEEIRDIQENARTMMLHAAINWLMAMSVSLWPYAIRVAVDVMNATPQVDKLTTQTYCQSRNSQAWRSSQDQKITTRLAAQPTF